MVSSRVVSWGAGLSPPPSGACKVRNKEFLINTYYTKIWSLCGGLSIYQILIERTLFINYKPSKKVEKSIHYFKWNSFIVIVLFFITKTVLRSTTAYLRGIVTSRLVVRVISGLANLKEETITPWCFTNCVLSSVWKNVGFQNLMSWVQILQDAKIAFFLSWTPGATFLPYNIILEFQSLSFLSSSMVEPSAVNRKVTGSNPVWGGPQGDY